MEISGIEITLRRINQIEANFAVLTGQKTESGNFENVLRDKLNSTSTELPNEIFISPFNQNSSVSRSETDLLIKKYSQQNNIDENLVKAVIKAESGYNPNAVSPAGAQGLMQLMPSTAKGLGVNNPLDPEQNIAGGVKYLKGLLNRFEGKLDLALAAYNAGPNAVKKYGGIPPYNETQNYVKRVLEYHKDFAGY